MQKKYIKEFSLIFRLRKESLEQQLDRMLIEITSEFGVRSESQKRKITEIARDKCIFAIFNKGVEELTVEDREDVKCRDFEDLHSGFVDYCRSKASRNESLTFDGVIYKLCKYIELHDLTPF